MCNVCGCGAGETRIEGEALERDAHAHDQPRSGQWVPAGAHGHGHHHADGTWHRHAHATDHAHPHGDAADASLHYGHGPAGAHAPGMSQSQMVSIEQNILAKNDGYAARNRRWLADRGILALNLVSSPGSGKTTLLVRTIDALKARPGAVPVTVVEGDQQTSFDAERIRATGAPALQINTGKGCHLDAAMVGHAIDELRMRPNSYLFIENVGNLVCPAAFDLGEEAKVAILSVTEGEDKPLKYPDMFTAARLAILNKIDLAPHCDVDLDLCEANLRRVNPTIEIIRLSARTGEGMETWLGWLRAHLREVTP